MSELTMAWYGQYVYKFKDDLVSVPYNYNEWYRLFGKDMLIEHQQAELAALRATVDTLTRALEEIRQYNIDTRSEEDIADGLKYDKLGIELIIREALAAVANGGQIVFTDTLRAALEWYADEDNYSYDDGGFLKRHSNADEDHGKRARAALAAVADGGKDT